MRARTVYSVLEQTALAYPTTPALKQPLAGGKGQTQYQSWTWREYLDIIQQVAVGLRIIGVAKGTMVALQAETRVEFYFADFGIMSTGAIAAALYTSLPYAEQAAALQFCEAHFAMVENAKAMRLLKAQLGVYGDQVQWIVLTGDAPETSGKPALTLAQVIEAGKQRLAQDPQAFEAIRDEYTDTDLAILYMTSGATGAPKMGLVSHRSLVVNIDMTPHVFPVGPDDCTVAFLPSAHMAQRVVAQIMPARTGSCVWFSEGLSKLPNELKAIGPTFFLSPPRVWERIYSSVTTEIRKRPAAIRKLFYLGIGLGSRAARLKREGKSVPPWISAPLSFIDKLMFSKVRERLGGRLKFPVSGAAPLSKDLAEFYEAIGMPLLEGYGLTEGGVISVNPVDRPKPGSIGKLLPGVEVKLDEDGELLVHGDIVFSGYFKDPDATEAVMRDGWLATGDIATKDSEEYYYITGRKKDLIVASNGKKIYPARIEGLFKKEPLISHVLLIGDRLPYITALITVTGTPEDAADAVAAAVKIVNRELASFEQIRKYKVLDREFTIEQGELTPTMKLRRSKVLENHRDLIAEMYVGREID